MTGRAQEARQSKAAIVDGLDNLIKNASLEFAESDSQSFPSDSCSQSSQQHRLSDGIGHIVWGSIEVSGNSSGSISVSGDAGGRPTSLAGRRTYMGMVPGGLDPNRSRLGALGRQDQFWQPLAGSSLAPFASARPSSLPKSSDDLQPVCSKASSVSGGNPVVAHPIASQEDVGGALEREAPVDPLINGAQELQSDDEGERGDQGEIVEEAPLLPNGMIDMEKLPSKGSADHFERKQQWSRTCKPCHRAWALNGCANGYDCDFCHFTHPKRPNRRKQKRLNDMRRRLAAKAGVDEADANRADEQLPEAGTIVHL